MSIENIGFSFYGNAHCFRNPVGLTPYVPANCVVNKSKNMPFYSVPKKVLETYHSKKITFEVMKDLYHKMVLDNLDAEEVVEDMINRFGKEIVICGVYKNPAEDHRSVFMDWINLNTNYNGIEVAEQSELYGNKAEDVLNELIMT